MKLRIAAAALLATAALASPALAANDPLIEVVQTVCVPNHALADKVMAAADASGWGPVAAERQAPLKARFNSFAPTMREKQLGDRRLLLVVGDSEVPDGATMQTRHRCWVESDRPNSSTVVTDLTAFLGHAPTLSVGSVVGWAYVDEDGQRTFLSEDGQMKSTSTLIMVMYSSKFEHENIGYNETTP
jgi:hypothetical protein